MKKIQNILRTICTACYYLSECKHSIHIYTMVYIIRHIYCNTCSTTVNANSKFYNIPINTKLIYFECDCILSRKMCIKIQICILRNLNIKSLLMYSTSGSCICFPTKQLWKHKRIKIRNYSCPELSFDDCSICVFIL